MHELVGFMCYLLSGMGLTVLVVWPEDGPLAWFRDTVMRRILREPAGKLLDCYVCLSFWSGLLISPLFWTTYRELWCWSGPISVPALFWLLLRKKD